MVLLSTRGFGRTTLRYRYPDIDRCPLGHPIDDVTVRCPNCGQFVLLMPSAYRRGRVAFLVRGMIIVLAAVSNLLLFSYTHEVSPLYWFLLLGVVHLYATVFTRGAALGSAAWFLSAVTVISVSWAAVHGRVPTAGTGGGLARAALLILPVAGWLLVTVYMFLLGRQALTRIVIASSYFLACASLTLGFWGVWLFYVENGLVSSTIYWIAAGVGLLLPVLCILLLFTLPGRIDIDRQRWLLGLSSFALIVLAANLILVEPFVKAVSFILGEFIPRLVGAGPLNNITTDWLGGANWRAAVTSMMLLVAVALVVVRATLEASSREAGTRLTERAVSAELGTYGVVVASSSLAEALTQERVDNVVADPASPANQAYEAASFAAGYLGEIALLIFSNILTTFRQALYAVMPPVAFSLLGMLMVLVLGKLGEYLRHGPFLDAVSLWGMLVTVLAAAVMLSAIAFDFAPTQNQPAWRRLRLLGIPLAVVAAGSLLVSLGYFLISLASWALLPLLMPSSVAGLFTGNLYVVNLAISTVALVLLGGLFSANAAWVRQGRTRVRHPFFGIPAAGILVTLAVGAVLFGASPIRTTFISVTGPYSATTQSELRARVPAALAETCEPDYLLVPGQLASVACQYGDTEISYHAFATSDALSHAYQATLHARGIDVGSGSCMDRWPAESQYSNAGPTGRVACYVDRHGAWLLWTDQTTLGIALRSDANSNALFAAWLVGTFSLRPQS